MCQSPLSPLQGISLVDFVRDGALLSVSQLCSNEVQCVPTAVHPLATGAAPAKLSFDLSLADDSSLSPAQATAAILAKSNDDALKRPKTARSVRLFLLLRVRARRAAGAVTFRKHWLRMRMKALSVLVNTERTAAISAPSPPHPPAHAFTACFFVCVRLQTPDAQRVSAEVLDMLQRAEPTLMEDVQAVIADTTLDLTVRRDAVYGVTALAMVARQRRVEGAGALVSEAPSCFFADILEQLVTWMRQVRNLTPPTSVAVPACLGDELNSNVSTRLPCFLRLQCRRDLQGAALMQSKGATAAAEAGGMCASSSSADARPLTAAPPADALDVTYAEALMANVTNLIIVFTAPAGGGVAAPGERWFIPQMLAALECAGPAFHHAVLCMLRSLDIFLEVSQAAMQLFHDQGGAAALLRFCDAVLHDAMTHVNAALSTRMVADYDDSGNDTPLDYGTVPASHRVVVRVRPDFVSRTVFCWMSWPVVGA
jgi:hypothetical protein